MVKLEKEELESKYFRGYYYLNSEYVSNEIVFGLYSPGGGTIGEICMKWVLIGNRKVPQMQSYYDSWRVLSCFTDLLDRLSIEDDNPFLSIDEFIEILKSFEFIDTTSYKGHYIPESMFKSYQIQRKRKILLDNILINKKT